jgi:hypothetical protein
VGLLPELRLDGRNDRGIVRWGIRGKAANDSAAPIHQEFLEIPQQVAIVLRTNTGGLEPGCTVVAGVNVLSAAP